MHGHLSLPIASDAIIPGYALLHIARPFCQSPNVNSLWHSSELSLCAAYKGHCAAVNEKGHFKPCLYLTCTILPWQAEYFAVCKQMIFFCLCLWNPCAKHDLHLNLYALPNGHTEWNWTWIKHCHKHMVKYLIEWNKKSNTE